MIANLLATVLLTACGVDSDGLTRPACNGDQNYCDRAYNEMAQICTHNAMSSVADGFSLPTPNQGPGLAVQLEDGVRCMMLDTYEFDGELVLCHGLCGPWGMRSLNDGLTEIRRWLDENPTEVVTFILEPYIDEAQTLQALGDAGLVQYIFTHPGLGKPWPTLGEMIDANTRLVVFTGTGDVNGTWHLDWRVHGWETPFNDDTFTCENGRGDPTTVENGIFILNHYTLCDAGGCPENAEINNDYDFLLDRALRCSQPDPQFNPEGQLPTFINLDHYDVPRGSKDPAVSDAFEVIRVLNGG